MVGPAARVAVRPSTSANGNGHLAVMGDSTPTIGAPIQALDPATSSPVLSRHIIQASGSAPSRGTPRESFGEMNEIFNRCRLFLVALVVGELGPDTRGLQAVVAEYPGGQVSVRLSRQSGDFSRRGTG